MAKSSKPTRNDLLIQQHLETTRNIIAESAKNAAEKIARSKKKLTVDEMAAIIADEFKAMQLL